MSILTSVHKSRRVFSPATPTGESQQKPTGSRFRLARSVKVLLLCLASVLALALGGSTANASTGVHNTGIVGAVREAAVPATCYNSAYGYYVRAAGPAVWARALTNGEKSQYVRWVPFAYDATTRQYLATGGWSNWALTTTTRGVQFGNDLMRTEHRGDVIVVIIYVQWYSPSYRTSLGLKSWQDSSYYIADQYRLASHC